MNYNEIMEGIKGIVNNPLRKFKPDELKKIVKKYTETHKKSKELYDRARKIIPGGVEHNLAFNFPLLMKEEKNLIILGSNWIVSFDMECPSS